MLVESDDEHSRGDEPDLHFQEKLFQLLAPGASKEEAVVSGGGTESSVLLESLAEPAVSEDAPEPVLEAEEEEEEEVLSEADTEPPDVPQGNEMPQTPPPEDVEAVEEATEAPSIQLPEEVPRDDNEETPAAPQEVTRDNAEEEEDVCDEEVEDEDVQEEALDTNGEPLMALPVDVEPLPKKAPPRPELPPRLRLLQTLLQAEGGVCQELGLSYNDVLRRLGERAAAMGAPEAARLPVSFSLKVAPAVKVMRSIPARPRRTIAPSTVAPAAAKVAAAAGPLLVEDDNDNVAATAASTAEATESTEPSDAYRDSSAAVVLLRTYLSENRWLGVRDGFLIFEDDKVQYPLSTLTPLRLSSHEDEGNHLLSLGSLFLVGSLRERYKGSVTRELRKSFSAKKIPAKARSELLDFLLRRRDTYDLLQRVQKVSPAEPSSLPLALGQARAKPDIRKPLSVEDLQSLSKLLPAEVSEEEKTSSTDEVSENESEVAPEEPCSEQPVVEEESVTLATEVADQPQTATTVVEDVARDDETASRLERLRQQLTRSHEDTSLGRGLAESLTRRAALEVSLQRLANQEAELNHSLAQLEEQLLAVSSELATARALKRKADQELQVEMIALQSLSQVKRQRSNDANASVEEKLVDEAARSAPLRDPLSRLLAPLRSENTTVTSVG